MPKDYGTRNFSTTVGGTVAKSTASSNLLFGNGFGKGNISNVGNISQPMWGQVLGWDEYSNLNAALSIRYLLAHIHSIPPFRLTLTSGTPVTTTDVTGVGNLYYSPMGMGNSIVLPYGAIENAAPGLFHIPEIGIPLSVTSGTNYDVFIDVTDAAPSSINETTDVATFSADPGWTTGTYLIPVSSSSTSAMSYTFYRSVTSTTGSFHPTLADALANTNKVAITTAGDNGQTMNGIGLSLVAWTNNTTRATALSTNSEGFFYYASPPRYYRYLGTIRASGTNTTEDSLTKRFVWNFFNRSERPFFKSDATASWNYSTNTIRQARADSANQVEWVQGLSVDPVVISAYERVLSTVTAGVGNGVGIDTTTTMTAMGLLTASAANDFATGDVTYRGFPGIGYHYGAWLERGAGSGTQTWYGTASTYEFGLRGYIRG